MNIVGEERSELGEVKETKGKRLGLQIKMRRRRDSVRAISIGVAFLFVLAYTYMKNEGRESVIPPPPQSITGRKLLGFGYSSDPSCLNDGSDGGDEDNANCSHPLHQEDPCQFVKENCGDDVSLFDYLSFIACSVRHVKVCILTMNDYCCPSLSSFSPGSFLPSSLLNFLPPSFPPSLPPSLLSSLQPLGYVILSLWLVYLISLLATTVRERERERERGWHTLLLILIHYRLTISLSLLLTC